MRTPAIAWHAISPALTLAGGAILALLVASIKRKVDRRVLVGITLATVGGASYLTYSLKDARLVGMQRMVASDGVALFTNIILLFALAIVALSSYGYMSARKIHRTEYYPLLMLATAGMVLLASANDLIMLFIALEVLSLALYVLVGIARHDAAAQEGSLKYFLLGSFSSAILLYGLALAYGATGTTNIARIAGLATADATDHRLIFSAVALLGVGLLFKIGAVPFHMWTPDAYQGAPTPVTGFMAAGTKAAAFAALLRVFLVGFGSLAWDWRPTMYVIAILTMIVGSLIAIVQQDVKRLLAYSSIAHAGFILIGLVATSRDGVAGSLFYLLAYAVMTLGAFAAIMFSGAAGDERLSMASWQGIGQRSPVFAGVMTLFLLSLAGIPPTAGFMGKFFVFSAAINAGQAGLVVVAVLTSVIAAFFYLRLIVVMWLQEPAPDDTSALALSPVANLTLAITSAAVLFLGVYPQILIDLARRAAIFTG